jgi:hypothetical protein
VLASLSPWITGLGVPALLAVGAGFTWVIRSTIEDLRQAERELADRRSAVYEQVLAPFLLPLIAKDSEAEAASAAQDLAFSSPEYRRSVFDLTFFASDDVVRAFGDMTNNGSQPLPENAMVLWARLLLAIRKSLGNKGTRLKLVDMLRPSINDIDQSTELLAALSEGE